MALVLAGCAGGWTLPLSAHDAQEGSSADLPSISAPPTVFPASGSPPPADSNPSGTPLPPGEDPLAAAVAIISLVNEMRIEEGVSPLAPSVELITIAFQRSEAMVADKYFGHTDPFDLTVPILDLLQSAGFQGALAENLFAIAAPLEQVPEVALEAWSLSATHKALLLDSRFHLTGVGLVCDGTWWKVTQVLAEAGP
jgi:uncharacterized protein YkwD